ncbi:amino acid permease [Sphingomonas sp. AP4-R1]|uniref:APC family permease n=1 Tax=Sphingomonas sp. AP4-R1 TaxID=2735134 RepID=UPI001493D607|nr:amino acid permease [Sphingomonas sp. AP4-R1]QJU60233.1 amino acid permease [Sphingomonas sp. AP4-R1]
MRGREQHDSKPTLSRTLTLLPAMALIVTNVVGTGIFTKTRVMTCNVGSPWLVMLAFTAAGLLTLAGALTFAELGAMLPRSGGHYTYIQAAFGRLWAFLFGWMETLLDGAASVAAIAMVFAMFLNDLTSDTLSPTVVLVVTLLTIGVTTLLASASMHANGLVVATVTVLKVVLVLSIGLAAFWVTDGSFAHFSSATTGATCANVPSTARYGIAGFGAAMTAALWAYNGWADLSFVAEEVRRPGITVPRAIIGASLLVIMLYLVVNLGYFYALGPERIAALPENASVAGALLSRLLGASGASFLIIAMMISTAGALHSTALSIARIPFGMARDGLLPKWLAAVSPRGNVPVHATVFIGVCACLFALSGTFDALTDMIVFALVFFNALGVASVYVLRRKLPDMDRPYRVPGYPLVPAAFLIVSAGLMLSTLATAPTRAIVGIMLVATGVPIFMCFSRRNATPTDPAKTSFGGRDT